MLLLLESADCHQMWTPNLSWAAVSSDPSDLWLGVSSWTSNNFSIWIILAWPMVDHCNNMNSGWSDRHILSWKSLSLSELQQVHSTPLSPSGFSADWSNHSSPRSVVSSGKHQRVHGRRRNFCLRVWGKDPISCRYFVRLESTIWFLRHCHDLSELISVG